MKHQYHNQLIPMQKKPTSAIPRALILFVTLMMFAVSSLLAQPYGDYTLYSKQNSNKAYLLDLAGNEYHSWTFASNQKTAYGTYMLPGGTLVRSVSGTNSAFVGGATVSVAVQKVDWNGNITWQYNHSNTTSVLHHDICPLPNGNVLMIAYDLKTAAEVVQAGCSLNAVIWSEKIMEVEPTGPTTGNVVWEWKVWDHLCQDLYPNKDNYVTSVADHPGRININYLPKKDWMHMNGVDYNPTHNQITFSSHNLNEIYVIDRSTTTAEASGQTGGNSGKGGDILYRWGNPAAYGVTGTKIFNVVHDAHWVPDDCPNAGYLSAFNNKGGTGNKTCVDLIDPPYSGYLYVTNPGAAFAPATSTWRHTYSGSATSNMGSAQQLPNGNTFICIAMSGYLYEIDSNHTVVWSKSLGASIPKAFRYTEAWVKNTLSTVDPEHEPLWTVYPNPSSGTLNFSGLNGPEVIIVTSLNGQQCRYLLSESALNLHHLAKGVYFVQIERKLEAGCRKVLITW
jgi:hypothetical protein